MWRTLLFFIWGYLKGTFAKVGYEVVKDLIDLAKKYVAEAALNPDLTNAQRREWVAEQLRNHAIETGNPVADSLINLVIEIALQGHRSETKND